VKVYLIGSSEGHCKIGVSDNPQFRAWGLDSTRLPFELTLLAEYDAGDAARFVEKSLHKHFAKRHVRGEWFLTVSPKEFLNRAKAFVKRYVAPKPQEPRPDIYAGKPWGRMCARERGKFIRVAASVPEDIREEMYCYAFTKAKSEEQLNELLKLVYLGMTFNEKTFQAI
jgi:hypothetical protein